MPIVPIHGHDALRDRLLQALRRGALPQSLLFHGPEGIGKQRLAIWLAQTLLCEGASPPCGACRQCRYSAELTHPDLIWVFPRPRVKDSDANAEEIRQDMAEGVADRVKAGGLYAPPPGTDGLHVATMRMLVREASGTPAMARRKVYLVADADRMAVREDAAEAANAFLKLLEEPPADTFLILTSSAPGALLPTIRSRVVAMRVAPLPDRAVAAWMSEPLVRSALGGMDLPSDSDGRVRLAGGAPGRLLASNSAAAASDAARRMLDVAMSGDAGGSLKTALGQGVAGARGTFSDVLDALTVALHATAREATRTSDMRMANNASRGIEIVEESKLLASGNVNPQLITASLLRNLTRTLGSR